MCAPCTSGFLPAALPTGLRLIGVLLLLVLVLVLLVTLENKVNSEPDLFKFVQVRSGWVPSRVGVWLGSKSGWSLTCCDIRKLLT